MTLTPRRKRRFWHRFCRILNLSWFCKNSKTCDIAFGGPSVPVQRIYHNTPNETVWQSVQALLNDPRQNITHVLRGRRALCSEGIEALWAWFMRTHKPWPASTFPWSTLLDVSSQINYLFGLSYLHLIWHLLKNFTSARIRKPDSFYICSARGKRG